MHKDNNDNNVLWNEDNNDVLWDEISEELAKIGYRKMEGFTTPEQAHLELDKVIKKMCALGGPLKAEAEEFLQNHPEYRT